MFMMIPIVTLKVPVIQIEKKQGCFCGENEYEDGICQVCGCEE